MNAETDETRVECSKESFAIHLQTSSIPRDATGGQLFSQPSAPGTASPHAGAWLKLALFFFFVFAARALASAAAAAAPPPLDFFLPAIFAASRRLSLIHI